MLENLQCRQCGKTYPSQPLARCLVCTGALEVSYDYPKVSSTLTRESIKKREKNIWRYRELLPCEDPPGSAAHIGFTPLVRARNLARHWGLKELWIKNDAVSFPSLSFKDRPVSVAIAMAMQFGIQVVGCASTGNLANSVASQAAACGLKTCILIPANLEAAKINGTLIYGANLIEVEGNYDDVNGLCAQIAERYGWGFVNVNLRPYYSEGSKTLAFEIMEQLGWRTPRHFVVPVAGGALITKVYKAITEFQKLGIVESAGAQVHGAQPEGCAPVVNMVKRNEPHFRMVQPRTIAKSLSIGNPADGNYAAKVIRDSGGTGESANDEEIVAAIHLLASTEGIFTETAGGVVVGAAEKLIRSGRIQPDESVVLCITGNGLKTQDAVVKDLKIAATIQPSIESFNHFYQTVKKL